MLTNRSRPLGHGLLKSLFRPFFPTFIGKRNVLRWRIESVSGCAVDSTFIACVRLGPSQSSQSIDTVTIDATCNVVDDASTSG